MAIGTTNLKIPPIKQEIGETTDDFQALCESANRNRWGVNRKHVSGATSAARLSALGTTSFKMTDWRGYNHSQSRPSFWPIGSGDEADPDFHLPPSGGSIAWNYVSLGAYTLSTDVNWITLRPTGSYNHTITTNPAGDLTGGADPFDGIQHHSLEGDVLIQVSENTGDARKGNITLSTPDDSDTNVTIANRRLTIGQSEAGSGYIFTVEPLYMSFVAASAPPQSIEVTWAAGITSIWVSKHDTGNGITWFAVATGAHNSSPVTLSVTVQDHLGSPGRQGDIRISAYAGPNLVETKTVIVYQDPAMI